MLPGFTSDLAACGVPAVDFAADVAIRNPYGWAARFPSPLKAYGVSREFLEWRIRQRVLALPGIEVLRGQATGLIREGDRVGAVALGDRTLAADFVADATGRGSRADHWLAQARWPTARETFVDCRLGYATRRYLIPEGHTADWAACYIQPGTPHQRRGAILMPVENNRWIVTLIGFGSDRPGRDEGEFTTFAKSLSTPLIAEAIADAKPLTPVAVSTSTSSRRHHVEKLPHQPANFVRFGEAVCAFNPLYAQGMSTAAWGASLLADHLARYALDRNFAASFHRALARRNDWAWQLATTTDTRWLSSQSSPPAWHQRVGPRYTDRLMANACHSKRTPRKLSSTSCTCSSRPFRSSPPSSRCTASLLRAGKRGVS
ncbi:NAD(P)/FAD-dependent oxidoreductase [Streptomyces syringium]|uniref:NAD(P)/FAD-dependent oxidoreductase n=1 Tax=Streptomyces syringium TaxID=76729 RepID=UPI003455BEE6